MSIYAVLNRSPEQKQKQNKILRTAVGKLYGEANLIVVMACFIEGRKSPLLNCLFKG